MVLARVKDEEVLRLAGSGCLPVWERVVVKRGYGSGMGREDIVLRCWGINLLRPSHLETMLEAGGEPRTDSVG